MGDQGLSALLTAHRRPPVAVDDARMTRERHARLQAEMARQGVDVALLLHAPNVTYATGAARRSEDVTHAVNRRPMALVVAGAPPQLVADVWPELDEGVSALADLVGPLAGKRVAVDEMTGAMLRAGVLDGATVVEASQVTGPAKLTKTADELACIAEAQRRNEAAMVGTQAVVRPGVRRSEVAGEFLAQLASLDGTDAANLIDPIFEPMPRTIAAGPRTTTGHVAFPTGVGDPVLADGDLVWVDTGIDHRGYASDFGRTWVVGRDPTPAERELFTRWCGVMVAALDEVRPGATGGELCRAAEAVEPDARPWLPHFYLVHGLGVESAEMPLLGTDLGPEFDESLVLAPGMVLVVEPVIWEEGVGGYRAEEIVAVTDDGWCHLGGGHDFAPFGS
jgi:Xaa-Pro dipeptidase